MTLLELLKRQRAALIARDDEALARLESAYTGVAEELSARIAALEQRFDEALAAQQPIKLSWVYQQERYQSLLEQAEQRVSEFSRTVANVTVQQQQAGVVAAHQNLQEHLGYLRPPPSASSQPALWRRSRAFSPMAHRSRSTSPRCPVFLSPSFRTL